jgi:hypothetical protein
MHRLLLLLLLTAPLAGCDLFGLLGGDSSDYDYMDALEGTWTLGFEEIRINTDGTTQTIQSIPNAAEVVFAQTVVCPNGGFVLDGGDLFARAYTFVGDDAARFPNGDNTGCGIIFVDDTVQRINFIGTGFGNDVMTTIDEDSGNRQVWSRYRLFEGDGYYLHLRYTLTR